MSRLAHGFATDAEHEAFQVQRAESAERERQRWLDNNPAKATTAPHTLTDDDLSRLPYEVTSRLMNAGGLEHLGIGARKHR